MSAYDLTERRRPARHAPHNHAGYAGRHASGSCTMHTPRDSLPGIKLAVLRPAARHSSARPGTAQQPLGICDGSRIEMRAAGEWSGDRRAGNRGMHAPFRLQRLDSDNASSFAVCVELQRSTCFN